MGPGPPEWQLGRDIAMSEEKGLILSPKGNVFTSEADAEEHRRKKGMEPLLSLIHI